MLPVPTWGVELRAAVRAYGSSTNSSSPRYAIPNLKQHSGSKHSNCDVPRSMLISYDDDARCKQSRWNESEDAETQSN